MVSLCSWVPIIAVIITLHSLNLKFVYCDGEESGDSTVTPMESEQTSEQPPEAGGYPAEYDPSASTDPPSDSMVTPPSDQNPNPEGDNYQTTEDPSGDGGTTINYEYEFASEEPDKFGEELLTTCKAESNYQGDFSDPNESSRELKCFYACAMVKMDVMVEEDGQITFSEQVADDLVTESLGDNAEMIDKYKTAIAACNEEVTKGDDRCDYAYNFITCGIQKLSG